MAKSKHEKELARDKKKKDLRRKIETRRQAMAASFKGIQSDDFAVEDLSAKATAMAIHATLDVPYSAKPTATWQRLKAMLSEGTIQMVNDLVDAGFLLRRTEKMPLGPPPINVVLMQTTESRGRMEPVSQLIQKCRGHTLELASELLDLYQDTEIVLMVSTLKTFPHHMVVGKSRAGEEFAAIVHEGQWQHLADAKMARRFKVQQDAFEQSGFSPLMCGPDPHVGVLERVMGFQGFEDLTIPGILEDGDLVDEEICKQVIDDAEAVILSSSFTLAGHLAKLAVISGEQKRMYETEISRLIEKYEELKTVVDEHLAANQEADLYLASPTSAPKTIAQPAPLEKPLVSHVLKPKPEPITPVKPTLKIKLARLLETV